MIGNEEEQKEVEKAKELLSGRALVAESEESFEEIAEKLKYESKMEYPDVTLAQQENILLKKDFQRVEPSIIRPMNEVYDPTATIRIQTQTDMEKIQPDLKETLPSGEQIVTFGIWDPFQGLKKLLESLLHPRFNSGFYSENTISSSEEPSSGEPSSGEPSSENPAPSGESEGPEGEDDVQFYTGSGYETPEYCTVYVGYGEAYRTILFNEDVVELHATVPAGKQFAAWTSNPDLSFDKNSPNTIVTIPEGLETVTFIAEYEPFEYGVTVNPCVGGSVVSDKNAAAEGKNVTLSVTPGMGYAFSSVEAYADGDIPLSQSESDPNS